MASRAPIFGTIDLYRNRLESQGILSDLDNAGPGVSRTKDEVTISAINRNFPGRSGPGQMYLASPLTVAASVIEGKIAAYCPRDARVPHNAA